MRHPCLHSVFSVDNRHGLSSLSKEMSDTEIVAMVQQLDEASLYLLASGPKPHNPAEIIASEQMRRLINILESSYQYIVIDSPPITTYTDGVLIATMVDSVVLVVRSGKTSRRIVRRSQQILTDIGAKIFGVVLNDVSVGRYRHYDND